MSGHSKWSGIKHQKAITDKKRAKVFTKLANNIAVAVREGGGPDSSSNPRLRDAIQAGRDANMPSDNIKRSIERGSGKGGAEMIESLYEGYGPSGVAVLAEVLTDNKNRAAGVMRAFFTKYGGKLGAPGSVEWMFETRGVIRLEKAVLDETMLKAIDAGATDVEEDATSVFAYTDPKQLMVVSSAMEAAGLGVISKSIEKTPKNSVVIDDEESAATVIKFMEELEDLDDVTASYANFDITPEITEKLIGAN